LEKKHVDFLEAEYNISDVDALDDDAFDELYEKLCMIEESEAVKANGEHRGMSERGEIVADIVTYMGNQYEDYESIQDYDEPDVKIAI
jgi:hypothetical protein